MINSEKYYIKIISENRLQEITKKYYEQIDEAISEPTLLTKDIYFGAGKPIEPILLKAYKELLIKDQSENPIALINKGLISYCLLKNELAVEFLTKGINNGVNSLLAKIIINKLFLTLGIGKFYEFSEDELENLPSLYLYNVLYFLQIENIYSYNKNMIKYIDSIDDNYLKYILNNFIQIISPIIYHNPQKNIILDDYDDYSYIGAIGYRFSGGAALVDFLKSHHEISAPFGEYKAISDLIPILYSNEQQNIKVGKFLLWLDKHILGLTKPIHYFDLMPYSMIQNFKETNMHSNIIENIYDYFKNTNSFNNTLREFINVLWNTYLNGKKRLLLPKIFKLGDFRGMDILPRITTILIVRDPRDQYVDRVNSGWMEENSHKKFISQYEQYIKQTEKYIKMYKNFTLHKYNFEDLVTKQNIRDEILDLCALDKSKLGEDFDYKKSQNNIGLWKKYENQKEIDEIAKYFNIK